MKFILLACFALYFQPDTILNQYRADYKLIINSYKKHTSISFSVTYNNFRNSKIVKADTSLVGKFYMKGQNYDYKMAGTEIMRNGSYYIAVNSNLKTIVVNDAAKMKGDFMPMSSIDSVISKIPVVIKYGEHDGGKTGVYKINAENNEKPFGEMEMVFDKQSYLIQKIVLFVSNNQIETYYGNQAGNSSVSKPRVDCIYGNYQFDKVDDYLFSSKRFIEVAGNEFKPAKEYAKYKVVPLIPVHAQSK